VHSPADKEHLVQQEARGLAARAGRWSAHHRRTAIFGWLAFVILAVILGGAVPTKTLTVEQSGVGESGHAARVAADAFPRAARENVLVQSRTLPVDAPAFRRAIDEVSARLRATTGVRNVQPAVLSADRHAALISFTLPGGEAATKASVAGPLATVRAAAKDHPEFQIQEAGDASMLLGVQESFERDLSKAETTSLPLTLAILVFAFGALVAAGLPLLLAITGVAATLGFVGPISQLIPVDQAISNVIVLIGLAVGVDYSLFYLKRVREERAAGAGRAAAIEAAAATSGHAVLVSGTILVVAVSVLGSLTVLPAALSALGDRIERGRLPRFGRPRRASGLGPWPAIIGAVQRRPLAAAVISGAVLIALAIPALSMRTSLQGTESLSREIPAVRALDRIQAAFPSESTPATVVVEADDVTAPEVQRGMSLLRREALAQPELFTGPPTVELSDDHTVARITLPAAGTGTDEASREVLDALRGGIVPRAFGAASGVTASVGGLVAQTEDFNASLARNTPIVFAFVLGAALLLLLITFRSLVIAIKAIVLNLLSVGAAYGVLVLVFQHGDAVIAAWLPLFLFVVLFGLSMDYHVFVLSRIREARDRGLSTRDAVAQGITTTAGVITSAALVMVGVFGLFGTLSNVALQQMGVGLAAAVALDATVIRGVLLPATMTLLGERNWWLPRHLHWLPQVQIERAVPAES
jgi:RND superfamily putative drug exporter